MNKIDFMNEVLQELNIKQIKIAEVTGYTRQFVSKMLKSEKIHKYQEMALICGLDKLITRKIKNEDKKIIESQKKIERLNRFIETIYEIQEDDE